MSWLETRTVARLAAVALLAALTAGCFQPMYAERGPSGDAALRDKLSTVEFPPLNVPNGSREARLGVAIRNELMFKSYGGGAGAPPLYKLAMRLQTSRVTVITDSTTARPETESYGIDATYELREIATDKVVMNGSTSAHVTNDIPGQEQRFARDRGLRDAEDRAAKVIAENISTRLASYFYAGM
ncbi:MAG: hypothetical protein EKK40_05225 [Bradyrhizobiaceae bacterium]|nr:MAG: hypothetical protein EKK40_05225 [Bradyrhizobiaceae bacterium]